MAVKNVKIFKAGSFKTLVDACHHVFSGASVAIRTIPHEVAGFGRNDYFIAVGVESVGEHSPEVGLCASGERTIVVGEVKVRDAHIKRRPHRIFHCGIFVAVSEIVPHSERYHGQLQPAVSAKSVFHNSVR